MELSLDHVSRALGLDLETLQGKIRRKNYLSRSGIVLPEKFEIVSTSLKKNWKSFYGVEFSDSVEIDQLLFNQAISRLLKGRTGPFALTVLPDKRSSHDMSCKCSTVAIIYLQLTSFIYN